MPSVDWFEGLEGFVMALIVASLVPFLCPTAAGYADTVKVLLALQG